MMILALIVALLPGEKPVYRLSDYVQEATDCAKRGSYGGQNRVLCDLAEPLKRALADCFASVSTWTGDADVQCEIEGPSGLFYWASSVDLCHGGRLDLGSAKIFSAIGVTPIVGPGFQACRDRGLKSGKWEIANATMRPYGTATSTVVTRGLDLKGPHRVRNVTLHDYVQGIRIVANAEAEPAAARANANNWALELVQIQGAKHAGIWIDGPDTNVGFALKIGVTSSCKRASEWPELGACADIHDGSFLGCTWVATATGYAKDEITGVVYPGIILGDSGNSRSVCVGCYIEGGYGGGLAAGTTNVVGGIGSWSGGGNRLEGNRISGLEAFGSDGLASLKLGSLTGGGALTITPLNDPGSYPLRLKYVPASSSFVVDVANIGSAQVLRIGAKSTTPTLGLGGLLIRPNAALPNVFLNTTGYILQRQVP